MFLNLGLRKTGVPTKTTVKKRLARRTNNKLNPIMRQRGY